MEKTKTNSKKKWLIGCSVIFFVTVIIAVIGIYLIINKTKSIINNLQTDPPAYVSLLENDNFVPPSDNKILEQDLVSYLKVTKEMRKQIENKLQDEDVTFNWESDQNYINLVAKMYEVRTIQADVLEKNQFSIKKYKWITRQLVIIFGGNLVKQMNLLIKVTNSEIQEIDSLQEIKNVPQENLELFNSYEDEIQEAIHLWALGI